jgi:hypothetical protein
MTLHYYQNHAQDFFDGTVNVNMTPLYEAFTRHLTPVPGSGCRLRFRSGCKSVSGDGLSG